MTKEEQPLNKKDDKKAKVEELSEEDLAIKTAIDAKVDIIVNSSDFEALSRAIEGLTQDVRGSTATMTAVPKPLKFLRGHFEPLLARYESLSVSALKQSFADLLSVLATVTLSKESPRRALRLRTEGTGKDLTGWGQEYLRALTGQLAEEYGESKLESLKEMIEEISRFYFEHSAELEGVDLLAEADLLHLVPALTPSHCYERVAQYVSSLAEYSEREVFLRISMGIYLANSDFTQALFVALKLNDSISISEILSSASSQDAALSRQLAHIVARQRSYVPNGSVPEDLNAVINQDGLSVTFKRLATDLDVATAKTPEEVFKSFLDDRAPAVQLDSARANLAASFANAFVNLGHGSDKLLTVEGSGWLFKNKDLGMFSTAASLGLIHLWDLDEGLAQLDKYQWSADANVKGGALLGFGLVACGVNNDCDPAFALLAEHVESEIPMIKTAALLGLGFAYLGSRREELREMFTLPLIDGSVPLQVSAIAALALGMVFLGSGDLEIVELLKQALVDRKGDSILDGIGHLFVVAVGLVMLGSGEKSEAVTEGIKTALSIDGSMTDESMNDPKRMIDFVKATITGFAFAGSGDVLRIQQLLQLISSDEKVEAAEPAKVNPDLATPSALVCLGLIALGEPTGAEMVGRLLDRIHQYGSPNVRRAIPLVLALLHLSDPKPAVIDTLSKFSHDQDSETAVNAIFGMGLVGLGSNNSRLSGLFRQLATYFAKDANTLFMVRLSQGLLYCSKGLVSCSPLGVGGGVSGGVGGGINRNALGCLGVLMQSLLALKSGNLCSNFHYLLFMLVPAISPRMLVTLDAETGEPLPVGVRVGLGVDVTGLAGKPKTITGFQTHTTPVLLSSGDRAELATDEWLSLSPILEGIVLLKKNPKWRG